MNTNQWLIQAVIIMTVEQCSKVLIALIHNSCGIPMYMSVYFRVRFIDTAYMIASNFIMTSIVILKQWVTNYDYLF